MYYHKLFRNWVLLHMVWRHMSGGVWSHWERDWDSAHIIHLSFLAVAFWLCASHITSMTLSSTHTFIMPLIVYSIKCRALVSSFRFAPLLSPFLSFFLSSFLTLPWKEAVQSFEIVSEFAKCTEAIRAHWWCLFPDFKKSFTPGGGGSCL